MNKQEAIKTLQELRRETNDSWYEETYNMAIEALKQETVPRETYEHEFNLRKKFEMKVFELEKKIVEQEPSEDWEDYIEWIPCSKRMPEEREWIGTENFGTTISDEVLVTFESRGERFVRPMKFQNGELGCMDKHMMDTFYDEWKAVAWMSSPEPYKGE